MAVGAVDAVVTVVAVPLLETDSDKPVAEEAVAAADAPCEASSTSENLT